MRYGDRTTAMTVRGSRVALFVAQGCADEQLWVPARRLLQARATVVLVGPRAAIYESQRGAPIPVERGISTVDAKDFHAIVVPGGRAAVAMRQDPWMIEFVRRLYQRGRVVAGIGCGVLLLLAAGAVRHRRATSCRSIRQDLLNADVYWVDQEVVSDGHVITSRRDEDLPAFCRALLDSLRFAEERGTRWPHERGTWDE